MLIPSIDLKGGKVVQLVQGARVAIESTAVTADVEDEELLLPFPPDSLLYPDAYQPPPFRTKEVLEISLWAVPPQTGQIFSLSWKSFCHSSKIWRQSSQQYS